MNKADLTENIAGDTGISKADANKIIDIITGTVIATLKKGGRVTIKGFGSFYVITQSARNRRNPQTGAIIKVGATKVPRFLVGKDFKDTMQQ